MGATVFFVSATKIYQSKAKNSKIKKYSLCLRGDFSANNMKKAGLSGYVYDFSVDYKVFGVSITNINKYLRKKA